MGGWRTWLLRVLLLVVSPLALLAVLEVVLRVAGFGYPTGFFITADGGRTWTENPRFPWQFSPPGVALEPEHIRLAGTRAEGVRRIFILGESAAQGLPDPAYGFGRVLEVMLRERHPGLRVEIVNTALMGIDSHAVRLIARDCAARGGDVFVIYMGNNEMMGPCSPVANAPLLHSNLALIRVMLWAKSLRVGQLAGGAWQGIAGGGGAGPETLETFLASAVAADDPRRDTVCRHFRANLEDILRAARRAGACAVAATVATNVRDFAPLASLHRPGLAEAERAEFDRLLAAGEAHERAGRLAEAEAAYRRAAAVDGAYAEAHFRLGRCLLAEGRAEEARPHYARARDLDALPFRAVGPLNAAVREAARGREAEGIYFVDAEAALEAAARPWGGIPGEESFYEHCHMNCEGNCRLAEAVLPAVEAALGIGPGAGPAPTPDRCARHLALTDHDRCRIAVEMAGLVAKPPFTHQSDHALRQERMQRRVRALADLDRSPDAYGRYGGLYAEALRRAPDDPYLHGHLALLKFDAGDAAGAADEWHEVLRLVPQHLEARVRLGDALARQGRVPEALALWTDVLRERPECLQAMGRMASALAAEGRFREAAVWVERAIRLRPEAGFYQSLGDLLAQQGKMDEAARQYRKGLAVDGGDVELRVRLASALAAQKEFAGAAGEFQRALEADPRHLVARCGLARALAQLGRTEEAIAHYRQALSVNPRMPEALMGLQMLGGGAAGESFLDAAKKAYHLGPAAP
jgi:tetratricopeptide (TPR) repeat protein